MMQYYNKDALYKIRKILIAIKECSIEFRLSRAEEYYDLIDNDRLNKYLKAVNDRISFINLTTQTLNALDIMNTDEVINVIYEFIKTSVTVLDLGNFVLTDEEFEKVRIAITELQNEIKKNKNKKDIRIQKLQDLLKDIFEKLRVFEYANLDELTEELRAAYEEAKKINEENDRLSQTYGGSYGFVKTLSDVVLETELDRSVIEKFLIIAYNEIKDTIYDNALIMQGKRNFIDTTKAKVTKKLLSEKLYSQIKGQYNKLLEILYTNLLLYKESI